MAAAANHGHKDVVEFLLANNADINAKDCHGETALNAAAGLPCKDVAELLLANGAEFTIHDVASLGDMDKVKSLLKANPELVFSKNQSGMTPLHCAVWRSQQDTVEFLLVNKADVNARDKWNATPLHFAATKGIVELLLANKAEVNARDYEGLSPLGMALEGAHHPDLVKLLRQHGGNDLWTDFLHAIKDDRLGDFNVRIAAVGQVHVDHGGVDALMAQQRLDGVDRRARLGQMRGKGMTQRVRSGLGQIELLARLY